MALTWRSDPYVPRDGGVRLTNTLLRHVRWMARDGVLFLGGHTARCRWADRRVRLHAAVDRVTKVPVFYLGQVTSAMRPGEI